MPIDILVVCDDDLQLDCVSEQLTHAGYIVHSALSGAAAIEWLRSHRVDMVITDFRMPHMNGAQLRELIRDENSKIPIILMTGERDHTLGAGFDGFLQKPFTMSELLSEVDRVRSSIRQL